MGILKKHKDSASMGAMVMVVLILFIALGFFCYSKGIKKAQAQYEASKPQITAVALKQQIMDINELSTVEYNYTTMGQFKDSADFYGLKIPLTTKGFIVSYDGVIKAGVDLAKAEIDIKETVITVALPKAKILAHQVDEESFQIYDEKSGLFNRISLQDYTRFQLEQKQTMEDKAIENGILEKAYDNAKTTVKNIIQMSARNKDYTIVIKEN